MTTKRTKPTLDIKEKLPADAVTDAIQRMAAFLLSTLRPEDGDLAIVGIQTRGAIIAQRIARELKAKKGIVVPVGAIDITLYRDDFSTSSIHSPLIGETDLDFGIDGKRIFLIDDVLFTGRTVRAALDEIMDFGRPESVTLGVLVDRGHRELPIEAAFVGKTVATARNQFVSVHLHEIDGDDEILVGEKTDRDA